MFINFALFLAIPGVICVPLGNNAIADVVAVSPDSERLVDAPRTLIFDKLHKLNPMYWFSEDEDISDQIKKLEKRQRVLYDLITCGNPRNDRCKKLIKLAAKLFNKNTSNNDDDDDDDKPESKPESKPQNLEEKPGKPIENPGKPENSEEKPATVKPEDNESTSTAAFITTTEVVSTPTDASNTLSNEITTSSDPFE